MDEQNRNNNNNNQKQNKQNTNKQMSKQGCNNAKIRSDVEGSYTGTSDCNKKPRQDQDDL
jgi:hypothetical protein